MTGPVPFAGKRRASLKAAPLPLCTANADHSRACRASCLRRFWRQLLDRPQDRRRRSPHGHLGELEGHVAAAAPDLGADLDRPDEVGEVVGERVQLQPKGVGIKTATR
jgi:hypothetical protein